MQLQSDQPQDGEIGILFSRKLCECFVCNKHAGPASTMYLASNSFNFLHLLNVRLVRLAPLKVLKN